MNKELHQVYKYVKELKNNFYEIVKKAKGLKKDNNNLKLMVATLTLFN